MANSPTITVRLPADMIVDLDDLAETEGVTRSAYLRHVLGSHYKQAPVRRILDAR